MYVPQIKSHINNADQYSLKINGFSAYETEDGLESRRIQAYSSDYGQSSRDNYASIDSNREK